MKYSRTVTLREHTQLPYSKLDPSAVASLERLVDELGIPALRFFRQHLKTTHYVGVLHSGHSTIQVVPKIYDDDEENLGFLILLLAYTSRLKIHTTGVTGLATLTGSFLEIWIRHFADELNGLLRKRFRREYQELEERTPFVRGKLLVQEMNRGLERVRGRYPCRYEVFTEDNRLNRVLRYSNHLLRSQTDVPATQSVLRENDILLGGVPLTPVRLHHLDRIHLNRLNRHYEPILDLCRLLLEHSTLDVRTGQLQQLALLFDMNRLFEEFVGEFLRRHGHRVELGDGSRIQKVTTQKPLGRLFGEFSMFVDLVLTDTDGRTTLVDTKYKRLESSAAHRGLSQSDFYQMHGYARAGSERHDEIVLLYPRANVPDTEYRSGPTHLRVRFIDLRRLWTPGSAFMDTAAGIEEFSRALNRQDMEQYTLS